MVRIFRNIVELEGIGGVEVGREEAEWEGLW